MEQRIDVSPRRLARLAGGLYLAIIIGGLFALGFVPASIITSGDALATAHNIQSHELLYRSGLTVHLLILTLNIPLALIFYKLLRVVSRNGALLVVFFTLVGTALEGAYLLNQFVPLSLLAGHSGSALTAAQLATLSYLPLDLENTGYSIQQVFYSGYLLAAGYLVIRSTFLPRVIGVLLTIGAVSYLVYSFASLLAPDFAGHLVPYIQLPSLVGEGSFCIVLLVVGINQQRWHERAVAG